MRARIAPPVEAPDHPLTYPAGAPRWPYDLSRTAGAATSGHLILRAAIPAGNHSNPCRAAISRLFPPNPGRSPTVRLIFRVTHWHQRPACRQPHRHCVIGFRRGRTVDDASAARRARHPWFGIAPVRFVSLMIPAHLSQSAEMTDVFYPYPSTSPWLASRYWAHGNGVSNISPAPPSPHISARLRRERCGRTGRSSADHG